MVNSKNSRIEEFDDVESINKYNELIKFLPKNIAVKMLNFGSRDNARHTMLWDNSKYAGFSETEPWITMHSRAGEINLENDLKSDKSVFRFYKNLIALRKKSPVLTQGEFELISNKNDNFLAFCRKYKNQVLTVVCNFEKASSINIGINGEILLSNMNRTELNGVYKPYETAVCINNV